MIWGNVLVIFIGRLLKDSTNVFWMSIDSVFTIGFVIVKVEKASVSQWAEIRRCVVCCIV